MKLVNTIFIMAIAMALVMASNAAAPANVEEKEGEGEGEGEVNFIEADPTVSYQPSLRTTSRFLAQKKPKSIKCNRNPSVCLSQGSLGPHCCHNKCVDLTTDDHNCGRCGNKCKFTTKCCRGQCVWLAYDKRHCGRCNHRCSARDLCLFGMCSYG